MQNVECLQIIKKLVKYALQLIKRINAGYILSNFTDTYIKCSTQASHAV